MVSTRDPAVEAQALELQGFEERVVLPENQDFAASAPGEKMRVWRNDTGYARDIPVELWPRIRNSKLDDGRLVFSTAPVPVTIPVGTFTCRLHESDPDRSEWDRLRLPVCTKDNLDSSYALDLHMRHKHKKPLLTIEKHEQDQIRQESLELQRRTVAHNEKIMESLVSISAGRPPAQGHQHRYVDIEIGSACKTEGCDAIRPS